MHLTKRNNLIDLLRFIAAIFVVLYHIYRQVFYLSSYYANFLFDYGKLGVPMFFVISGYCILLALTHAKTSLEFIVRRFFRIFPPYWFSLFLTILIILILTIIRGKNSLAVLPKNIYDIGRTICLLTYPITNLKGINWVYWTLPYEVMFYVAIFFCSFLKRNYFTLSLILLTVVTYMVPSSDLGFISFFKFWPLFSIGAALFKLLHEGKSGLILNVLLFFLSLIAFYPAHQTMPFFLTSMLTVILIFISHYKPLKDNKISRLGDVSYSIYLIHVPLLVYTFGFYRNIPPLKGNGYLNVLLDIMLVITVIIASKIMFKYIELPAIKAGKRLSAKLS